MSKARSDGSDAAGEFVPAAGRAAFTHWYDAALKFTTRERRLRRSTLTVIEAELPSGGAMVDIGSGTGTLAIEVARRHADATVIGVELDDEIAAVAQAKQGAGAVQWQAGNATDLPLADGTADVAVLSLVLHHLQPRQQTLALAEAARVVAPGGALVVADWGRPGDPLMWAAFTLLRSLDGFSNTAPHASGALRGDIALAGFAPIYVVDRFRTLWGVLEVFAARRFN